MAMLFSVMSFATEVTVSIAEYATANGWVNSTAYNSLTMDEVVTVTANPTTGTYNNTGKYYDNGTNWRMYQNEAPAIVVTAAEGYLLTSVTFTYESNKTGVMVDAAGAQVASGTAVALDNVASATFSVSNTNPDVSNGQARITAITVVYEAAVVEPTEVTVYCINSAKWDVVACHHWVEGGSTTSWPGDVMTKTEETVNGFDVYAATFTIEHTSCIFNNNNNGSQTGNLTVENGHYYYVKDAKWYASLADVPALDPLATNVYLAGEMNGWSTVANEFRKATEDATTASLTLTLEAATTYQFKVVKEGAWLGNNGTITASVEGWTFATGTDNCKLTTDAAGEYVLTWDLNTDKLTVTYPKLPAKPEVVTEMVGIVKRAIQNGDNTIVLTHEADGTAHIYELANGTILELVQEGVVPVDPENKGSYLAISDIALTEDGKLVANNYVRCQFAGTAPEDGYKLGTSYYYIWDDLTGAPRVWFTSQATARSSHGDMGKTFAVKGTSTDAKVLVTAVHNNNRAVRMALYSIIDGVYEEPDIAGGTYNNDYYFNFGLHTTANYYKEATQGKEFYLLASPLADASWIIEGELSEPSEFLVPAEIGADYAANQEIAAGTLGNKYQGTSIVTVDEKVLMVAPYADAEGKLAGVKVLDITAGLAAATEVATANLDAAVEATAAATAVAVAENTLTITLVADATIYTLNVELESEPEYWVIEDNITNLVIDLESMAIMGGPSTMWQVEVYLGLAEDDNLDGQWSLSPESSVAIMGLDARFIDGYVYDIDVNAPAAKAVLHVEDNGSFYEIKLDMTSTPQEAIVVVVEDATVQIDTVPMFGDVVEYALKMTANWTYAEDGVTYPVSVEVPVYYPEATEPSEMTCTVTIGGNGDTDPWLGFGEGTLTITTVDGVVTAKGIVANPYTGVAFDVTVSGKLPAAEPVKHTVTITVNPEGAGTVTGAGEYEDGAEVTVKAEENEGYIFLGWMEDGEFVAEDYEYTFTILNDVDLVAVYATQLVGVAEDLVITETALTATAILSTGTTLTVNLVLGEYDEEQGAYWLAETTTLTLGDKALTLLDGLVMVNAEQQTAIAVVLAEHEGVFYAFTLMLAAPASGVDNINTNVAPRKVIRDGQLIIIKNGVEYNVQGAILK